MGLQSEKRNLQRRKSNAEGPLNSGKMSTERSCNQGKRFFQQPLKSCPDTKPSGNEFFRNLFSRAAPGIVHLGLWPLREIEFPPAHHL